MQGLIKKEILQPKIKAVLEDLNLYSDRALVLLTTICAHESKGGIYLRQLGMTDNKTGAFGLYGMELNTVEAIFKYLSGNTRDVIKKTLWLKKMHAYSSYLMPRYRNLKENFKYSTALCRLFFVRFPERFPEVDDIEGMAKYWKKYYNTEAGDGTVEGFIKDYEWYMNE